MDRIPLVVLTDRAGEKYGYRCGQEMYFWQRFEADCSTKYVELNIIGQVKDLILTFDMSIIEVVEMIETAEHEALKRMKENE